MVKKSRQRYAGVRDDPIMEIIRAVHPPSDRAKFTAVFKAYFDDSGVHEGAKVISLSGFIADASVWDEFDREWKKALTLTPHPPLPEFHMSPCANHTEEFEDWSFPDRLMLVGNLIAVLKKVNVLALGSAIVTEHFREYANADEWLKVKLGHPYHFCFEHCIQQALTWAGRADPH
jgi:hypothetical protein